MSTRCTPCIPCIPSALTSDNTGYTDHRMYPASSDRTSPSARRKAPGLINRPDEDPLLDVKEAAAFLRTSERFPRRLIAERRIRFVRVGRYVRIPMSALIEVMELVEPMTASDAWRAV